MEGLDYSQRLKKLNLPTLQYRRRREQLIQVYKLINNAYDTDCSTFFEKDDRNITRGNSYKLKTKRARLMLRANFFSVGVVRDWNSLPDTVVTSGTLNKFKNSLDRQLSADRFAQRWQEEESANTGTELMIWSIQVADLSSLTRSSRWFKVITFIHIQSSP